MESEASVPNSESCIGGVAGVATSPVYLAGVSKVGRGTGEVGIAPMVTHTTQAGSPLHRLKIAAPVLDLQQSSRGLPFRQSEDLWCQYS